jgi:hypothetical protein
LPQDFIDNYLNPLAVQQRALDDERDAALESAKYIQENFKDVFVDINQLTDVFTQKQTALFDQFYGGAITNLQNLISSLTYGDLSNASPLTTLAGLQSDYAMTLEQARRNDPTAISNFSTIASQLANYGRQVGASGPLYESIRQQVIADAGEVKGIAGGGGGGGSTAAGTPTPQSTANDRQIAQLMGMVSDLVERMDRGEASTRDLRDLMQRIVS